MMVTSFCSSAQPARESALSGKRWRLPCHNTVEIISRIASSWTPDCHRTNAAVTDDGGRRRVHNENRDAQPPVQRTRDGARVSVRNIHARRMMCVTISVQEHTATLQRGHFDAGRYAAIRTQVRHGAAAWVRERTRFGMTLLPPRRLPAAFGRPKRLIREATVRVVRERRSGCVNSARQVINIRQ